MQAWPPKDPDDVLDYPLDWSDVLAIDGDAIAGVVWDFPDGLTKQSESVSGALAIAWISGGTDGTRYEIGCRMTTTGGRIYDRRISLSVRQS